MSVVECVWHIILTSLEVEGTDESYESSEETSRKSSRVRIAKLLLEVFLYDKASLIFVKTPVLVELVAQYPHQGCDGLGP
jgi:hypothetical protein